MKYVINVMKMYWIHVLVNNEIINNVLLASPTFAITISIATNRKTILEYFTWT